LLGILIYYSYLYYVIKLKNMNTMLKNVKNPVQFDYDLFDSKIGYDSVNKKYLIRVYDYLVDSMNNKPAPTWSGIMRRMLGDNPNNCNPSSYYSSVRRCLKEIDVIRYEGRELVKGRNWDRFFSDENWDWFIMRTGSCEYSTIVK
jgi:hypothetical protein